MSINNTFDCDVNWVKLLNNKLVIKDFVDYIVKDSKNKDVLFHGSFICGLKLHSLIDEETVDLVSPNLKLSDKIHTVYKHKFVGKGLGFQRHYNTVEQYLDDHTPVKNKINIYFIGYAIGEGKYLSIHWNSFVVDFPDKKKGFILWYDPAYDEEQKETGLYYNFDQTLRKSTEKLISFRYNVEVYGLVYGKYRAQQVCDESYESVDIFCQTWILFFLSSYIEENKSNKKLSTWRKFLDINYDRHQNKVLKSWINCVLSNMKDYKDYPSLPMYEGLLYCRVQRKDRVKLEPTIKIKKDKNSSCVKSVVDYFYEH